MDPWRLIVEDQVSPAYGLAVDEVMARRVGEGTSPTTLRLYTYAPCALVGRFQTLENELHLAACEATGIPVNRRPTGGGAIVMGPDQLGVAWTVRGSDADRAQAARQLMVRFSEGIVAGLGTLGVDARFRGKNDLEVGGRKIAGLGVYRDNSGGLLYHCSLLVGLDVRWMLSLLNTPFEKITDKTVSTVSQRVTTVRRITGRDVTIDEARDALAAGFASAFAVDLVAGEPSDDERSDALELAASKYRCDTWVRRQIAVPDAFATEKRKTPAGLLEIRATLAGPTFKAVYVGGDFFASEGALADLEGRLRWHTTRPEAVAETVAAVFQRWGTGLDGLPEAVVVEAILAAAKTSGGEYGCFVNPGGDVNPASSRPATARNGSTDVA